MCPIKLKKRRQEKKKNQYTLTILPWFLLPHSRILLPIILKAFQNYIDDPKCTQIQAAFIMGCESILTFRLYYMRIQAMIQTGLIWFETQIKEISYRIEETTMKDLLPLTDDIKTHWNQFNEQKEVYLKVKSSIPGVEPLLEEQYDSYIWSELSPYWYRLVRGP